MLTASIVLFKNDSSMVQKVIDSFLGVDLPKHLYLVDNSPTDELRSLGNNPHTTYLKAEKNLGFGKAHNRALQRSLEAGARFHIILNPDVYFDPAAVKKMFTYATEHPDVGMISPKILYPDGKLQTLCKLLPTPADLFVRRFMGNTAYARKRTRVYEMHDSSYNKIMNIPYLSGCFMFLNNQAIKDVGGFEEKIFMYIEDADLTRRIHQKYKTIFYPEAVIYHGYQKGSYKSLKLMLYNIHGAIIYFNKWGWFFDKERRRVNKQLINDYL